MYFIQQGVGKCRNELVLSDIQKEIKPSCPTVRHGKEREKHIQ